MTTEDILKLSLDMAGLTEVPADTAVYLPGTGIRRVLVGIDLEGAELVAAKAQGFDLALAHHPAGGTAMLQMDRVFARHVELMVRAGVPEAAAQAAVEDKLYEDRISGQIRNYDRLPALAQMLGIAYMNIHTPLDEIGRRRMAEAAAEMSPAQTVADLISHFHERFGEFRHALTEIQCLVGHPRNRLGRVAVAHGAGTNGGYPVAKAYFDHGVDTVVYIHCQPPAAKQLAREYGSQAKNLVVTGHIASDCLGINPFIHALRDRGLKVVPLGLVPATDTVPSRQVTGP
jgi:putative NIF3 family GTP cyclohydrolase 1 type 2